MDGKAWLGALLGDELVEVRLRVREPDVVFVKGIMEASEGLGAMFAEPRKRGRRGAPDDRDGGALVIVAPRSRAAELCELIEDLKIALGGCLWKDESENHRQDHGADDRERGHRAPSST
ncbi:MAG TPA: hypothetical protein VHC69_11525 [Polyangiaceae bacterium]|nr:hypothetical protein [Polyangiaceae bacterium]